MSDELDGPVLIKSSAELLAEQEAKEKRRDRAQRSLQLWFNGILTFMTILTAGVVLYQNWILSETLVEIGRQSTAAEQQVIASHKQATIANDALLDARAAGKEQMVALERSSKAAEVSAAAAIQSAKDSAERYRFDKRAWVTVNAVQWNVDPTSDQPFTASIRWTNFGAGPAFEVRALVQVKYGPITTPVPSVAPVSEWGQFGTQSVGVFPPSANSLHETKTETAQKLSAQTIENLKAGRFRLYLIARVLYTDNMGTTGDTGYCGYWKAGIQLELCPTGNYAK